MMVLYLTEYNSKCYGVNFENNGCIKIQKLEDVSDHENNIFCVKALEKVLGKIEVCDTTLMSGAFDKSVFDGNNILHKMSEEYGKPRYI